MKQVEWVLVDIETAVISTSVHVLALAAQRMRSWERVGEPFHRLFLQSSEIPTDDARKKEYSPEMLERDGEPAEIVRPAFNRYVGNCPLVAFDLKQTLELLWKPEWDWLKCHQDSNAGFCAKRLVRRLLDPLPTGNCKVETLRQYYRLPELSDPARLATVLTLADLFTAVLRPIAEKRGLETWEAVAAYAEEEWYPSRLAFGKHKARDNPELYAWLEWLAGSSNAQSGAVGRWYLRELARDRREPPCVLVMLRHRAGLVVQKKIR